MKTYRFASVVALAVAAAVSLVLIGGAAGKSPKQSATPVFKLSLKPSQEVPRIQGLKANGTGSLTFDLVRDSSGTIISGEAIFYVNYSFPGAVEITGLHVHKEKKGVNGPVVINSGIATVRRRRWPGERHHGHRGRRSDTPAGDSHVAA